MTPAPTGQPAYQHNGQPVTADQFYAIACNPHRSVAVQACAGAGKTWMLVSRIVRALLEGGDSLQPHEILAITFTKKAAGEMRERLNGWLAEFSRLPPQRLRQELVVRGFDPQIARMPSEQADILLQNLYRKVLLAGRPVQIRTFHSWFAALLRTAPLALLQQLQLPSVYELLEDDTDAVAQLWPRFFQRIASASQAAPGPGLLADFHAAVQAHGRFNTLKALTAALSKRVEFALADAQGVVDRSVKPFSEVFTELAGLDVPNQALAPGGPYWRDFDAAAANLGQASAVTYAAKGSELEQALTEGRTEGALEALLTKGQPRKFSEKVPNIVQVRAAQAQAVRLGAALNQHQSWQHQQRMARLTRALVDEFSVLKRERGWIDMNDVERAAQAMLAHSELSGWLQQRLDARIRHLLIDEFQDTSPLQWQALSSWLQSYAGSGGGEAPHVFIVGDPKQSIYRFRRAEPQVFLAAQAFVREGLGGDLLSCDHTRRNATAVVSTVNSVMLSAQSAADYADFRAHTTDSKQTGAVLSLPAIPVDAAGPQANDAGRAIDTWRDSLTTPREVPEETRRTLECRQAAQWLAALLKADQHGSALLPDGQALRPQHLMVLARRRQRLSLMQDELRRLHIAALQPEKNLLGEAPEVKDIIALLDALLSPQNDLALAQALKSPLFGCSDEALIAFALAQRQHRDMSWFSLLSSGMLTRALAAEVDAGAAKNQPARDWSAVAQQLAVWQGWLASVPPHDALHAIYHDGDVIARFAAASPSAARSRVIANLRALLAAALDFDGGRYATPYALVRALKAGRVKAPVTAHPEAVQLLTVHGAKGLEAPLVLLLDTDSASAKAETMGVLVEWPGEAAAPTRFSFIASETRPPACNADALVREQAERKREELNALYVAMTRARHTLVLSSNTPSRPDGASWWARLQPLARPVLLAEEAASSTEALPVEASSFFLPELQKPMDTKEIYESYASKNVANNLPSDSRSGASPGSPSAAPVRADGIDDTDARIGQAMHRLLEWLPLASNLATAVGAAPSPGSAHWSDRQTVAAAQAFNLTLSQGQAAARMAHAVREGEGAWCWDATLVQWQANEVPLAVQGKLLRLDRLVQRRDTLEWWVLDYKSTVHPLRDATLVAQLRTYQQAVAKNMPQQAVKAAFLTARGRLIELPGSALNATITPTGASPPT